ncbi:MAG TPA: hypothetical protein GYA07_07760 [Verrucomicrobia bacterium]|nr:hypothetical protein [Verrucomicrobiota bacterium]HPU55232.1 phospholipase A [Verrucomicrobiota bacterium]
MARFSAFQLALLLPIASRLIASPSADPNILLTVSAFTNNVVGGTGRFQLHALNTSGQAVQWTFPMELRCELSVASAQTNVLARLDAPSAPAPVVIEPSAFASSEYAFRIPAGWTGEMRIKLPDLAAAELSFVVLPSGVEPAEPESRGLVYFLKGRRSALDPAHYDPDNFFKRHFFGYEPFYFLAGTKSPNAKFQISFKYRLFNEDGLLARKVPLLKGFHLAYSQTSLWDWNAPSAPFFDSSYRPEFLFSWDRLAGDDRIDWFQLDVQGGLQHESNGRDGANSRSLNIAYFRPRLVLGRDTGPQLTLTPRVWAYVGDLSDNPDIEDYRGYADLRAAVGWKRGLQVSALGRIGDHLDHGSVTVDATYPLMQQPGGSLSIYLHVQYFTGYGESLLQYNQRSEILRVGISLYR